MIVNPGALNVFLTGSAEIFDWSNLPNLAAILSGEKKHVKLHSNRKNGGWIHYR